MRIRRIRKGCDRCHVEGIPARYRVLFDRWVCDSCYPLAVKELADVRSTGKTKTGRVTDVDEELEKGF